MFHHLNHPHENLFLLPMLLQPFGESSLTLTNFEFRFVLVVPSLDYNLLLIS
jgi:hypothetical protein